MGRFTVINSGGGAGGGSSYTFGAGFNVNGTSVKFALDDPSNMLYDPGFEDTPDLAQWTQGGGSFSVDTTIFFQGARSAKTSTAGAYIKQQFHCDPGDQFLATAYCRSSSGATGSASVGMQFFDSSGGFLVQFWTTIPAGTTFAKFSASGTAPSNAAGVAYLFQEGGTSTGTWYVDNCSLRRIASGDNIQVGAIATAHLAAGSLGDLSKYGSTVRAVGITNGLPTLPDSNYPSGAIIFNTFDGKLYRNVSGAWSKGSDPADLTAGTIAAGVVYAGTINASQVNAGTFNGLSMILNLNGITTTLGNLSTGLGIVGIRVADNGSSNKFDITKDSIYGWASGGGGATVQIDSDNSGHGNISVGTSSGFLASLGTDGAGTYGVVSLSGTGARVSIGGNQVLASRVSTTPVTLADVIAVLQHHGLSN